MKIVVIDGQGGRMGKLLCEAISTKLPKSNLSAIGTNSIATSEMLKGGASLGATGENPVIVACSDADVIIGPIGIVVADSLLGEITPRMAVAIGQSKAYKILLPVNHCNNHVVGVTDLSMNEMISQAVADLLKFVNMQS